MYIKTLDLARKDIYKLLIGTVVPRPIAWISTQSDEGVLNLAPFSFFSPISSEPPLVCISIGSHKDRKKDTLLNIESTGEFVINTVTEELVEQMEQSATEYAAKVDEFERVGLTPEKSLMVKPPRVKEAKTAMECRLHQLVSLGGDFTLVIGEVIGFHISEDVYVAPYKIDHNKLKAVGRLARSYAKTNDEFTVTRKGDA